MRPTMVRPPHPSSPHSPDQERAGAALDTLRALLADLHRTAELVDQSQKALGAIMAELEAVRRTLVHGPGPRAAQGR